MIELSPAAAREIERWSQSHPLGGSYLRLAVKNGGCSGLHYHLELTDIPRENDHFYQSQGINILVDPDSEGVIELKYLDEAWFCLESPVSYSYSRTEQQKQMEQHLKSYGSRISILGLWQLGVSFEYALAQGGFKGFSYIQVMDWSADKGIWTLAETGRLTVVVQDNGSLHRSEIVRQQWQRWQEQGLYIFFLPPYCSEMNLIECQWNQLKTHEIAGRLFDNESGDRHGGHQGDEIS